MTSAHCDNPPVTGCDWQWLCQGPKCCAKVAFHPLLVHLPPLSEHSFHACVALKAAGVHPPWHTHFKITTWGCVRGMKNCIPFQSRSQSGHVTSECFCTVHTESITHLAWAILGSRRPSAPSHHKGNICSSICQLGRKNAPVSRLKDFSFQICWKS